MVKTYGMSEKAGVRVVQNKNISPATSELVDAEIKRLLQVGLCTGENA